MKESDNDKPIKPISKGIWGSNRPKKFDGKDTNTDLQGNGYPINKHGTSIPNEGPHPCLF